MCQALRFSVFQRRHVMEDDPNTGQRVCISARNARGLGVDGNGLVRQQDFSNVFKGWRRRPRGDSNHYTVTEEHMTMAAISSDRARFQIFARCFEGRPDLADKPLLIGVLQGHGVDKDIPKKYPWGIRRIPLNWLNQRRMAPLARHEHFKEIACVTHATQMETLDRCCALVY